MRKRAPAIFKAIAGTDDIGTVIIAIARVPMGWKDGSLEVWTPTGPIGLATHDPADFVIEFWCDATETLEGDQLLKARGVFTIPAGIKRIRIASFIEERGVGSFYDIDI